MKKYLAIEGADGSGKTVLSKVLAQKLNAFWTYEPNGETPELKSLRLMALTQNKDMTDEAREYIMLANRSIHFKKNILPNLEKNIPIVTDRSFFSGMVYSAIKTYDFGIWLELLSKMNIPVLPDTLVFCRSSKRKIEKNLGDIYDNAEQETIDRIDTLYEKGLNLLKTYPQLFNNIKVVEFYNDFELSIEENADNLIKILY